MAMAMAIEIKMGIETTRDVMVMANVVMVVKKWQPR